MLTRDPYLMYMTEPELWAKSHRNHGEGNKEIRLCADDDRVRESELNPRHWLHLRQGVCYLSLLILILMRLLSLMKVLSLVSMLKLIFFRELGILDRLLWLLVVVAFLTVAAGITKNFWSQWRNEQV